MEPTQIQNGNTHAAPPNDTNVETKPLHDLVIGVDFQGYGGYVIVERGMGSQTTGGLILPSSTTFEKNSLVHHVGAECRHGIQPGDLLEYGQATALDRPGPNKGKLFAVPENQIVTVKTHDGRVLARYTPPLQEAFREDLAGLGRRVSQLDGMPFEFQGYGKK